MDAPLRHPRHRARLPVRRLPDRRRCRSSRRRSCGGDADRPRRAVRLHERALRRRQHRHRGHDADGGLRRLVGRRRSLRQVMPDATPGHLRASRLPLLIGLAARPSLRRCSSRRSTPGCRSRVRADQIISGTIINIVGVGITGYLNLLISQHRRRRRGHVRPPGRRPTCLTDLPVVGWLFTAFLRPGPDRDLAARRRDRPPGPAVPVALGPAHAGRRRASRRRPRRSASTSSGCATGTSSWAACSRGSPAPT